MTSPITDAMVEAAADAIDLARFQHPEYPRDRPFSEADKSDREYAIRLARAALPSALAAAEAAVPDLPERNADGSYPDEMTADLRNWLEQLASHRREVWAAHAKGFAAGAGSAYRAALTEIQKGHNGRKILDVISALLSPASVENPIETLKNRIDTRLNNCLCEMKEGYDDSIAGFNQAWDIVSAVFKDALRPPSYAKASEDKPAAPAESETRPSALDTALDELERTVGKLRVLHSAAREIIALKFETYRAGNNRQVGVQSEDGEKCWIVHSDQITALEAAIAEVESDNVIFAPSAPPLSASEPAGAPAESEKWMTNQQYMRAGLNFAVGKAVEEMGECLAALGKTLRWGWHSVNPELSPEQQEHNADWVRREIADVRGALDNLEKEMDQSYACRSAPAESENSK